MTSIFFSGLKLNIATRVPISTLGHRLLLGVVRLCRDAETRVDNNFYNYCEIQPAHDSAHERFTALVHYLKGRQNVSTCKP